MREGRMRGWICSRRGAGTRLRREILRGKSALRMTAGKEKAGQEQSKSKAKAKQKQDKDARHGRRPLQGRNRRGKSRVKARQGGPPRSAGATKARNRSRAEARRLQRRALRRGANVKRGPDRRLESEDAPAKRDRSGGEHPQDDGHLGRVRETHPLSKAEDGAPSTRRRGNSSRAERDFCHWLGHRDAPCYLTSTPRDNPSESGPPE